MQTAIYTTVIGKTIRLMVSVNTHIRMGRSMKGTGSTISSMEKEKNSGLMAPNTKANTKMERKMDSVLLAGPTNHHIAEISLTTISMAMVHTLGPMAESLLDYGRIIRCMGRVFSLGPMVVSMKVTTMMIKKKVMEFFTGPTAVNMMATGKVASKKVLVFITTQKARSDMVDGRVASAQLG